MQALRVVGSVCVQQSCEVEIAESYSGQEGSVLKDWAELHWWWPLAPHAIGHCHGGPSDYPEDELNGTVNALVCCSLMILMMR